jgi:hypothetical protein
MTSRSLKSSLRVPGLLAAGLLCLGYAPPAAAADPEITGQPVSGLAANGEPFGFSIEAVGTAPLNYQWFRNGASLLSQTNSFLFFPSVTSTDAGTYEVVITNSVGSVTSAPVNLTLTSSAPRTTTTGTVTGGATATVPVLLSANGRENRLTFTLGFNTNIFANPSFLASVTNDAATLDTGRAGEGLVTGDVTLPAGQMFAPGRTEVGRLQFDFVTGSNPLAGGLYFTNASASATNLAFTTNATALLVNAVVSPQFEALTLAPALNRQSGLFEHVLRIGYPGAGTLENVDMLMSGLGLDSQTNLIRAHNATGLKTIGPDAEGFFEKVPYFSAGPLAGGETRDLTAEYYVTDHFTVPSPEYQLLVEPRTGFTVSASATPLNITTNRFVNGTFIIQWPSRSQYNYFVQYAPTMDDLVNSSTNARIVNPSVPGTGYSVQWIDNGPPKTESPPTAGSRFYRVLEFPVD